MTTNIDDLQPGQFFTVRTTGIVAAAIRLGTRSPVNHAGVYIGHGSIVEAQPGGAIVSRADRYPDAHWSDPRLAQGRGNLIAEHAAFLVGTPYGFTDIAALSLACFGIGDKPGNPIARRIESLHELICSQLVDRAHLLAGVHLFNDGRLSGQVTPGNLYTVRYAP